MTSPSGPRNPCPRAATCRLPRARLAAVGDVILVGDRLGADEALLEIGVDDPGRLRRLRALLDRPGPRLLGAGGEEGRQAADRSRRGSGGRGPARQSDRREVGLLLGPREHGDLALDLGRDDDRRRALLGRLLARPDRIGVARRPPSARRCCRHTGPALTSAGRATERRVPRGRCPAARAGRPSASAATARSASASIVLGFLVAALGPLLDLRDPPLEAFEVGQHQLGFDGLDVATGSMRPST